MHTASVLPEYLTNTLRMHDEKYFPLKKILLAQPILNFFKEYLKMMLTRGNNLKTIRDSTDELKFHTEVT